MTGIGTALHEFIRVREFSQIQAISRAARPTPISVIVENTGSVDMEVEIQLIMPNGVRAIDAPEVRAVRIRPGSEEQIVWKLKADVEMVCKLRLSVTAQGSIATTAELAMNFLPSVEIKPHAYIPQPKPAKARVLVGAHHCPLWEADKPSMWDNVLKHPERTPALGFYNQENPEIADWETLWAVEHGIDFFVYCWYRTSQGGPVTTMFSSAIHDALFRSRYVTYMKFTIMWENQTRGQAGVADERDLMENLFPFWMEHYFTHASYLKVDNKPVLFIYRPEFLVQDLGSIEKAAAAIELMRDACRRAGFSGLYVLGENRFLDVAQLSLMQKMGLDYAFAYCWPVENNPIPSQAVATQLEYMHKIQELRIMPQIPTVSQAWSGWHDEGSIWKIPPVDFEILLRKTSNFMASLPSNELGSRMLLLDNWNEWGEGHYIAPYREYGFGYLDAVRSVFTESREPHVDLIPEDIGMGPYDTAIRSQLEARSSKT